MKLSNARFGTPSSFSGCSKPLQNPKSSLKKLKNAVIPA
jgi:hypothetical protein